MIEKRELYLACGAKEVWLCKDGRMSFFNSSGIIQKSILVPNFPELVEIES
jgi:hypothetical protein